MRPIDADALIHHFYETEYASMYYIEVVKRIIDEQPTISPDEVRGVGEWIVKQTTIGKDYTLCSACKTDFKFRTDKGTLARLDMRGMPFCPNCGARMKGVSEDA